MTGKYVDKNGKLIAAFSGAMQIVPTGMKPEEMIPITREEYQAIIDLGNQQPALDAKDVKIAALEARIAALEANNQKPGHP